MSALGGKADIVGLRSPDQSQLKAEIELATKEMVP